MARTQPIYWHITFVQLEQSNQCNGQCKHLKKLKLRGKGSEKYLEIYRTLLNRKKQLIIRKGYYRGDRQKTSIYQGKRTNCKKLKIFSTLCTKSLKYRLYIALVHTWMAASSILIGSNWFLEILVISKSQDRTHHIKINRNNALPVKYSESAFKQILSASILALLKLNCT